MELQELESLKLPQNYSLYDFGEGNLIFDGSQKIIPISSGERHITARMVGITDNGETVFFEFLKDEPINALQERVDSFYQVRTGTMLRAIRCILSGKPMIFGGRAVLVTNGEGFVFGTGCSFKTTRWKALKSWVRYFFWKHDWIKDGINAR